MQILPIPMFHFGYLSTFRCPVATWFLPEFPPGALSGRA